MSGWTRFGPSPWIPFAIIRFTASGARCRLRRPRQLRHAAAEGRVIAVGTTAARTLETLGAEWRDDDPTGYTGFTGTFIVPGHRWRLVDALLTNFHLPRSTLMMLVRRARRQGDRAAGVCGSDAAPVSILFVRRRYADPMKFAGTLARNRIREREQSRHCRAVRVVGLRCRWR